MAERIEHRTRIQTSLVTRHGPEEYRAHCTPACGWVGYTRDNKTNAEHDRTDHEIARSYASTTI